MCKQRIDPSNYHQINHWRALIITHETLNLFNFEPIETSAKVLQ